ncbi:hypothetical protein RhiirA1_532250 [Rhizophagus irregularis]|uniref:Uncharacterized protein n=1 Tax=Rhizophagus irregularis TaxID=588596 RepID=A0A2N0S677_9GLOM|nr:hypothetical protein RhiirA1_532250 [Rhizophagus irregularis]
MIQRPGYPLYSLSLTAAIACLIYKYKCDYYVDEYLIDTLILEKIKEVLHFVKKCWNFNSAKFLEKIEQTKSYNCESIFFTLIHFLDLSIISMMFFVINIPYIIYIAIITLNMSILASWCNTIGLPALLFNKYSNICRINLKYERYMVEEIRKVLDPFGTYTDNMFDPLDPFNLLSVIYFHDDI